MLSILQSSSINDKEKLGEIIKSSDVSEEVLLTRINLARIKIIRSFSSVNRLLPDGIIEPITGPDLAEFIAQGYMPERYRLALAFAFYYKESEKETQELIALFERLEAASKAKPKSIPAQFGSAVDYAGILEKMETVPDNMPANGYVGEWLQLILKMPDVDLIKLSAAAGVSESHLSDVMNGKAILKLSEADMLCTGLDLVNKKSGVSLSKRARLDITRTQPQVIPDFPKPEIKQPLVTAVPNLSRQEIRPAKAEKMPSQVPAKKASLNQERSKLRERLLLVPKVRPANGYAGEWLYLLLQLNPGLTTQILAERIGLITTHLDRVIAGTDILTDKEAEKICIECGILNKEAGISLTERVKKDRLHALADEHTEAEEKVESKPVAAKLEKLELIPEKPKEEIKPRMTPATTHKRGLDVITKEFFDNVNRSKMICTDKERVVKEQRRLAKAYSARLMEEWGCTYQFEVVEKLGLTRGQGQALFKAGGREGLFDGTLLDLAGKKSNEIPWENFLNLSSMVNGNPTLPDMRIIIDAASKLMEACYKGERTPLNNPVLEWMKDLQKKHPYGKFVSSNGMANIKRIPNALVDIIVEKYNFDINYVWDAMRDDIPKMRKGLVDVAIFPNSKREAVSNAVNIAKIFSYDPAVEDKLSLLLLMIPKRRSPEELMEVVNRGEIKVGQMHRLMRFQEFLTRTEYVAKLEEEHLNQIGDAQPAPKMVTSASARELIDHLERGTGGLLRQPDFARHVAHHFFKENSKGMNEMVTIMTNPAYAKKLQSRSTDLEANVTQIWERGKS